MIDIGCFLLMRLRSIDFSLMLALKQVRDGESQLHVQDRGEDDTSSIC